MSYRVIYRDDALEHGGVWDSAKKGLERAGHKYLKREWKNGRWHYVYKTSDERIRDEQKKLKFNSRMEDHYYGQQGNKNYQDYLKGYYKRQNAKLDAKRKKRKPKNVKSAISKGKSKLKKFLEKNWGKVDTSGQQKVGKNTYVKHETTLKRN